MSPVLFTVFSMLHHSQNAFKVGSPSLFVALMAWLIMLPCSMNEKISITVSTQTATRQDHARV